MLGSLFLIAAILGLEPALNSTGERDSFEAALAAVGRDADAHVRLALWCEAHGLDAERVLAPFDAPRPSPPLRRVDDRDESRRHPYASPMAIRPRRPLRVHPEPS